MTRGRLVVGGLLATAMLTGCSDATEGYCEALQAQEPVLADLAGEASGPGPDSVDDILEIVGKLREQAPDDLGDEWDTLYFAWEGLVEAFQAAGTNPREYRPGQTSGEVTVEEDEAIQGAAADLASARVVEAARGIEQHAADVCEVDLGL